MKSKGVRLEYSMRKIVIKSARHFFLVMISVGLLSGCSKSPVVRGIAVTLTDVETTVTTINSGTVYAESQAVLNFGAMGRVAQVNVSVGDLVKKGAILSSLENGDLRVSSETARAELERVQKLFKEKLVSQSALDESRRAMEIARVNYEKSLIVAPFDGLVTDVNLRTGEIAQVSSLIESPPIRLVDQKSRIIKGDIDELDLNHVQAGMKARVKIPAMGNKIFEAIVSKAIPFVSSTREQDRTSKIELTLSEGGSSIPVGASADVEVLVNQKQSVPALPARAVLGTSRHRYVYKVQNGVLKKVSVEVGVGNYDRREMISGVEVGDLIALPGDKYVLEDGISVKVNTEQWP